MKKIFSKGLYAEGLRQTRMMTVIFTAVLIFGLAAYAAGCASSSADMIVDYVDAVELDGGSSISAAIIAVWFALIVMIAAPVITFRLFSFLSGRSESDFYHSLPYKRSTVFLSYTAALITQFAVMLASAGASLVLLFAVFDRSAKLNVMYDMWQPAFGEYSYLYGAGAAPYLLYLTLCFFAAALLCCGAALIGRCASGTAFNSSILYISVLLIPRLVIASAYTAFADLVPPAVVAGRFTEIFLQDTNINIPVSAVINAGVTNMIDVSTHWLSVRSVIYTAVLAIIYIALSALIFVKKKSEAASDPAPSKPLRFVYSVLVFCSVSFLATAYLWHDKMRLIRYNDPADLLPIEPRYFIFYAVALVIFLIYVLITTKKWSGIVRALPALGVGILLNAALAASVWGFSEAEINFIPTSEDVQWISVCGDPDEGSYERNGVSAYDLALMSGEKYRITDKEAIKTVCKRLSEYMDDYLERDQFPTSYIDGRKLTVRKVVIKTASAKKTRLIYLSDDELSVIESALLQNDGFRGDLASLPAMCGDTVDVNGEALRASLPTSSEIIKTLEAEMKTVDGEEFLKQNKAYIRASASDRLCVVSYNVKRGGTVLRFKIPVSQKLTPKTYALIAPTDAYDNDALTLDRMLAMTDKECAKSGIEKIEVVMRSMWDMKRELPGGDSLKSSLETLREISAALIPWRSKPSTDRSAVEIRVEYEDKERPVSVFTFGSDTLDLTHLRRQLEGLGF